MSTCTGSCIAVGPRSSGIIMASDWEHLLSCGIAQYDTNVSDQAVKEAFPRLKSTAQELDIFR